MLEALSVMVVDDNRNMRRLMTTVLRTMNAGELHEAADGAEALEMLASKPVDLVLTDYVMEGMDGVEFTRTVRERIDREGCRLPIIIVTGYPGMARLDAAKEAGAHDFITKPVAPKTLMQRINRVLGDGLTIKEMEDMARARPMAATGSPDR